MIEEVKFNSKCDIMEVIPDLAIDIADVIKTGSISGSLSVDVHYEGAKSTDEVGSYIRDNIDALEAQKQLNISMEEIKLKNKENVNPEG